MYRAKCPFYLSQSNGIKLYINCSPDGRYANCVRTEVPTFETMKNKLKMHCNDKCQYCETFKALKGGKAEND